MPTKTTTPSPTRWAKSAAWSVLLLALIPVATAVLWLIGRFSTSTVSWISRLGITWSMVGWGAVVVAGYGLLVLIVHAVRWVLAKQALYERAAREFYGQ